MAIDTDSSVSIVRLLLVRNYYACALVLAAQDHVIKVKLFQNGGRFLLADDMPILPMVWVKIVRFRHKNHLVSVGERSWFGLKQ